VDFGQYYDNPWLYRIAVQLGERILDPIVLTDVCRKVVHESKSGSPDQGAALTVIAYQLLQSGNIHIQDVATLRKDINEYNKSYDQSNPHAYRWFISLNYVTARLLLAIGNRLDAFNIFLACSVNYCMNYRY